MGDTTAAATCVAAPRSPACAMVTVFTVALDVSDDMASRLTGLLTSGERQRMQRYVRERDARRFMVRRAALRILLGRACRAAPGDIVFAIGRFGQPTVPDAPWRFSVTTRDDLAMIGITDGPLMGIDIERVDPTLAWRDLAVVCGSPAERAAIEGRVPSERLAAFLTMWTRKEAYLKALGCGLSAPLTTVTVGTRDQPRVDLPDDRGNVTPWRFLPLAIDGTHVGAVAVAAAQADLRRRAFRFDH